MNLIVLFFLTFYTISSTNHFPHLIWTYWNKQQTMKPLGRACLSKMELLHQNTDWKVNFITYSTLNDWLSLQQIEQLQFYRNSEKVKINQQQFADLLRFTLLQKYGGVWIDINTILIQNLNWLDNLSQNKDVFKIGQNPDVFTFFYTQLAKLPSQQQNNNIIYPVPNIQNFFIAAKPNTSYIIDTLQQFKRLILGGEQYFDKTRNQLLAFQQYKTSKTFPKFDSYFANYAASQFTLYKKYQSIKKNLNGPYSKIYKKKSDYYHHWTMSKAKGPYLHQVIQKSKDISCLSVVKPLLQDVNQIQYHPKYMIKLTHQCSQKYIENYLTSNIQTIQQSNLQLYKFLYSIGKFIIPQKYSCLYKLKIHQNSTLNKYLLKYNQNNQNFKNTKIYSHDQFPVLCNRIDIIDLTQYFAAIVASIILLTLIQVYLYMYFKKHRVQLIKPLNQVRKKVKNISFIVLAFGFQITILVFQFILKYFDSYQANSRIVMTFLILILILDLFIKFYKFKTTNKNQNQFSLKQEIILLILIMIQYLQIKIIQTTTLRYDYQNYQMYYYLDTIIPVQGVYINVFQVAFAFLFSLLIVKTIWSPLLIKYICSSKNYRTQKEKSNTNIIESSEIIKRISIQSSSNLDSIKRQVHQTIIPEIQIVFQENNNQSRSENQCVF